jgi:hypothetical protein
MGKREFQCQRGIEREFEHTGSRELQCQRVRERAMAKERKKGLVEGRKRKNDG